MLALRQDNGVACEDVHYHAQIDDDVNRLRALLRDGIDHSGMTQAFVARCLRVDEPYLCKMLNADPLKEQKPIGVRHLVALPLVVKHYVIAKLAEQIGAVSTVHLEFRGTAAQAQMLTVALAGLIGGPAVTGPHDEIG